MASLCQLQLLTLCMFAISHTSATKTNGGFIRVIENKTEPVFVNEQRSAVMSCRISLSNDSHLDHYNATWLKGDTPVSELKDRHRFTVSANCSLTIDKPSNPVLPSDLGRPFNRAVGQTLELTCKVKGYPVIITWYKDDRRFPHNDTHIQMTPMHGYEKAHLQITDLSLADSGIYRCEVWSDFFNKTVSSSIKVRVTEKYASLLPFLCLLSEVAVLCLIIFLFERYEKKKTQKRSLHQLIDSKKVGKKRKT